MTFTYYFCELLPYWIAAVIFFAFMLYRSRNINWLIGSLIIVFVMVVFCLKDSDGNILDKFNKQVEHNIDANN